MSGERGPIERADCLVVWDISHECELCSVGGGLFGGKAHLSVEWGRQGLELIEPKTPQDAIKIGTLRKGNGSRLAIPGYLNPKHPM